MRCRLCALRPAPSDSSAQLWSALRIRSHVCSRACRLTDLLIEAYNLHTRMAVRVCNQHWAPLSEQDLLKFHTDSYMNFLQQVEYNGQDIVDEAANFVLNSSVCFSETSWCEWQRRAAALHARCDRFVLLACVQAVLANVRRELCCRCSKSGAGSGGCGHQLDRRSDARPS